VSDNYLVIIDVLCSLWKVAGSIPYDVIEIFYWHNTFFRTIALVSTQPVT